jgi:2-C-methyl-D-erythritol 2,4-cyclodiphosphate synthase
MNRIGMGFDSHRFVKGRPLKLCGVSIDHELGLAGHSDGDAALHALIDAMLGASGMGDIGEHFPDTQKEWKNADSSLLVYEAMEIVLQSGWVPINCDVTIITEAPGLKMRRHERRERIADLLGLDSTAVSVKAKTAEGMGLIGGGEGLAAFAVVLMEEL